jgi:hypothetical protein
MSWLPMGTWSGWPGATGAGGHNGDDILIAGTTDSDANEAALAAIMNEWTRTDATYDARIGHLRDGTSGGLNGAIRLNPTRVHASAAVDTVVGGVGLDWFFAMTNGKNADWVTNRSSAEVLTALLAPR